MGSIVVSASVLEKLKTKHNVTVAEVKQCFSNKIGTYLSDDREEHQTDPPTLWFIAPTNSERLLKVIFVFRDGNVHLKSAYEPSPAAVAIYNRLGK